MTTRWEDRDRWLLEEAERDLRHSECVRPCLLAFRGEESLVCAFLREPPAGGEVAPVIEVVALTQALGADRLALSLSARAWSTDDPIPPVTADADLRQRIVLIVTVDGYRKRTRRTETIHPFEVVGGAVRWDDPVDVGPSEGSIGQLLEIGVRRRNQLIAPVEEARLQAMRCSALGHLIALGPRTSDRLGFGPDDYVSVEV